MGSPPTLNIGHSIVFDNSLYQIIKELGCGAFGRCYLIRNISSKVHYACKVLYLASSRSRMLWKNLDREVYILNLLSKCDNISKIISYHKDDELAYILLELYENNSLKDLVAKQGRLSEAKAKVYILQVINGVLNCHKNQVIHRDIKPSNVLIDSKGNAILSDFGLAALLKSKNDQAKGKCGTPYYMAPEVASGSYYSFSADIWSLGVMLLTLVMGYLPFDNSSNNIIYKMAQDKKFKFPIDIKASNEFEDIVSSMLNLNPEERPSIDQIKSHPFFCMSESNPTLHHKTPRISKRQCLLKRLGNEPENLDSNCYYNKELRDNVDIFYFILKSVLNNINRVIISASSSNSCIFNKYNYVPSAIPMLVRKAAFLKNEKVLLYELNNNTQGALFKDNSNVCRNRKNIKYQYTQAILNFDLPHSKNKLLYFPRKIPNNLLGKIKFFDKYRGEMSKRIRSSIPNVKFEGFDKSLTVARFSIVLGSGVFILSTGEVQITFKNKYKILFSKCGEVFSFADSSGKITTFDIGYVVNNPSSTKYSNEDINGKSAFKYLNKAKMVFKHAIKDSEIDSNANN